MSGFVAGPDRIWANLVLFIILAFSAFSPSFAQSNEGPRFEPVPDWVEQQVLPSLPSETPDGIADGLHYILFDSQYRVLEDERVRYGHLAYRIVDRAGLEEGARLSFEYDPSDTDILIHQIIIHRGDERLDRLDRDRFVTIRRESELQSGIIDGDLTSFIELRDVRVGDLVEYEYTYRTRAGVWPGGLSDDLSTQWSIPIERRSIRILTPSTRPLTLAGTADLDPRIEHSGEVIDYRWQLDNPQRLTGEEQVASGFSTWPNLSFSTMPDWESVVAWGLPHYPDAGALPQSAQSVLERVLGEHNNDAERITALIRFVQDDIRYVSESVGLGSHIPRSPDRVLSDGFGDCKDKAFLLTRLLTAMGVEAHVALTDIDEGFGLPRQAPSPFAFDHAIVRIEHEGSVVWIDATSSHHGGVYPDLAQPAYGYALPLRASQTELEPIAIERRTLPYMRVEEIFDLADAEMDGITLSVITAYRDREANYFRANLADDSRLAISENYFDYYQSYYPGIELAGELEVEDDRDANLILVREFYHLPADAFLADDLAANFSLRGDAVLNQLSEIETRERTTPIAIPWPRHQTHVHRLINTPVQLTGLDPVEIETPFAHYETTTRSAPDSLRLSYTIETLSSHAPPDAVGTYNDVVAGITDTADLWIDLTVDNSLARGFLMWLDQPGGSEAFDAIATISLYFVGLIGAILGFRRDRGMPDGARFHPVSPVKFLFLSIVTFNIYTAFWFWRCWRWTKLADDSRLSPIFRTWLSVIFFPVLATRIDSEQETSILVRVGVITSACMFSVLFFTDRLLSVMDVTVEPMSALDYFWTAISLLPSVFALPALLLVNAMNRDHPEVEIYNSRWSIGTVLFGLIGLGLVCAMLFELYGYY